MIDIQSLQERIQAEVGPLGLDDCCRKLVKLLLDSPVSDPIFTHLYLQQEIQEYSLEQIQCSLNYLRASPIRIFSQHYQYHDDEGNTFDISVESLQAALLDQALAHPDNGRLDPDFKEKIFVVYIGNKAELAE